MAELNRRLQVLIDEDRYERLRGESARTGAPVGAIVRGAIDAHLGTAADRDATAAAARRLLALEPLPDPEPDWADAKETMLDEMSKVE